MDRESVKKSLKEMISEFTSIMGVSGEEQEVISAMVEKMKPYADEIKVNNLGNMIAVKRGKRSGPTLLIASHSDEIGFCVKWVAPDGFIYFDKVGMPPDNLLLGRKVWVSQKKIPGIIGTKPGHLQTSEELKTTRSVRDLYIDVACSSKEEVEALGIRIGDRIVFQDYITEMANPDYLSSKAMDNRVSCAIVCELLKQCAEENFGGTLIVGSTCREEVGVAGARAMGHWVHPDYVIAVDTVPAGDTPDQKMPSLLPIGIGKGPVVMVADGSDTGKQYGIFTSIHPSIRKIIETQSEQLGINIQWLSLIGFESTTDAAAFAYSGDGIPHGSITIPRRYSHSPVELININDSVDAVYILKGIVMENEHIDLRFVKL